MARYDRKDHFHQRAKAEGYRSRAAYKLVELQRAGKLLRRGQRVVDLGCWPGGWLQVAVERVGGGGLVVGVDLAETQPLANANMVALVGDFTQPPVQAEILARLGGTPADVVLSDAAPKLTGIRDRDRAQEEELLLAIESCLAALLRPGGSLLVKILEGPEAQAIDKRLRARFESARTLKPRATRKGSSERYLLAKAFKA
jgi:23S rRNA (uridine2552-2'-O)-methyltransferase